MYTVQAGTTLLKTYYDIKVSVSYSWYFNLDMYLGNLGLGMTGLFTYLKVYNHVLLKWPKPTFLNR